MEQKALVTVIIPAYNEEKYLSQAIDSIITQTYENWELLIINDGSTDGTEKVANDYVKRDKRITYHTYEGNKGLSYARNYGTEKAKGKYICILGADDIAYPNMLELQVEQLEQNPGSIHVQGTHDFIDEKGSIILRRSRNEYKSPEEIRAFELFGNCITDGGSLLRKDILDSTGIKADLAARCSQDYLLWLHLLPHGDFICIDEPTFMYRIGYKSKTKKYISDNPEWYDSFMMEIFTYAWESRGFSLTPEEISFIYYYIYSMRMLWKPKDIRLCIDLYKKIKKSSEELQLSERMHILNIYKRRVLENVSIFTMFQRLKIVALRMANKLKKKG